MNAGLATVGIFAIVIGLWLFWHKNAPKITTALFLTAGICGIGSLATSVFNAMSRALASGTNALGGFLGVSATALVSALALVATLEVVIKGMWKKKAKPKRWHPWLALLLPTVIVVSGSPLLITVIEWFQNLFAVGGSHIPLSSGGGH